MSESESEYFLRSLSLLTVNIKLYSLRNYREATALLLSLLLQQKKQPLNGTKTVMLTVRMNEAICYAKTNVYYHLRIKLIDVSVITQLVRKFFNRII